MPHGAHCRRSRGVGSEHLNAEVCAATVAGENLRIPPINLIVAKITRMGNFGKIVSATNLSEADKTVRTEATAKCEFGGAFRLDSGG
jgi:hypothetical protein